jgi:hypothetical protein
MSPLASLFAVLIYGASGDIAKGTTFWSVLAVGVVLAGAALAGGILLGFLFGLPKTLDRPTSKALLATNTNLDQISDWLTKILVGIGLVQLGKISHGVSQIGSSVAPGLGAGASAKPFAVGLFVYSAVDGFLVGYIWTRIDLSKRFRLAAEDLNPVDVAVDQVLQDPLPSLPKRV